MPGLFGMLDRNAPGDNDAVYWRRQCQVLLDHGRPAPSPRQAECLEAIRELVRQTGAPPTMREIAKRMNGNPTPSGIGCFLYGLPERGYITRQPGRGRSLTLIAFAPPSNHNLEKA